MLLAVGRHFRFGHGWWERTGWREFRAYLRVMADEQRAREPDADRWTEASEANFDELRALRERRRKGG